MNTRVAEILVQIINIYILTLNLYKYTSNCSPDSPKFRDHSFFIGHNGTYILKSCDVRFD